MNNYNFGSGINSALQNLGNTFQRNNQMAMQREDRQRAIDKENQAAKAMQGLADLYNNNASAQEITAYSLANPSAMQAAQGVIKFKDENTKGIMRDTLISAINNPAKRKEIIAQGAQAIADAGGNPENLVQALSDDDDTFLKGALPFVASLDGRGNAFASNYINQNPIQKQVEQITPYQQAQLSGKAEDRKLRQQEIELRKLESEQKRETNAQKQQETAQKIEQKKQEVQETKAQDKTRINNAIVSAEQNKTVIDDLLGNDDYMDAVTGFFNYSKVPESARTTTQNEAAAYLDNIKNSMTIENLGVMSGPLTDKDIQIIASASSRLREGMGEKALKKELNTIKEAYDRVISNYQKELKRKGYQKESPDLSDDELLSKYL